MARKKLRDYFVVFTQPFQLLDMGPDVFDADCGNWT